MTLFMMGVKPRRALLVALLSVNQVVCALEIGDLGFFEAAAIGGLKVGAQTVRMRCTVPYLGEHGRHACRHLAQ